MKAIAQYQGRGTLAWLRGGFRVRQSLKAEVDDGIPEKEREKKNFVNFCVFLLIYKLLFIKTNNNNEFKNVFLLKKAYILTL